MKKNVSSSKEDITITPEEIEEQEKKRKEQNLMAIKGTPLEKLAKGFLDTIKNISKGAAEKEKIKEFTFSQAKGLIRFLSEMVAYDILDCEQYKTRSSKIAKFTVNINSKKKNQEFILLARPLPSTGEWRIYSFEDKKKILAELKMFKGFSDPGIIKSDPNIPFQIGVALMQWGEDDDALNYLSKIPQTNVIADQVLGAKVCLSILKGKGT